jgi:hypothetical protein
MGWAKMLSQIMGIVEPAFSHDDVEIILQSHFYFQDMLATFNHDNPAMANQSLKDQMVSNGERGA